jgi:hypothetical protein
MSRNVLARIPFGAGILQKCLRVEIANPDARLTAKYGWESHYVSCLPGCSTGADGRQTLMAR